jgi:hypothetical protein
MTRRELFRVPRTTDKYEFNTIFYSDFTWQDYDDAWKVKKRTDGSWDVSDDGTLLIWDDAAPLVKGPGLPVLQEAYRKHKEELARSVVAEILT